MTHHITTTQVTADVIQVSRHHSIDALFLDETWHYSDTVWIHYQRHSVLMTFTLFTSLVRVPTWSVGRPGNLASLPFSVNLDPTFWTAFSAGLVRTYNKPRHAHRLFSRLFSLIFSLFPCGWLSWQFLAHVKFVQSYRIRPQQREQRGDPCGCFAVDHWRSVVYFWLSSTPCDQISQ